MNDIGWEDDAISDAHDDERELALANGRATYAIYGREYCAHCGAKIHWESPGCEACNLG